MAHRLMAVFAHPDDESCGPGGTLALYADRGVDVTLVCVTRGELGGEPTPEKRRDPALGALRARELRTACEVLRLARCIVLDFPDGALADHVSALRQTAVPLIRAFRPQVVITFDPEHVDGGADHQAVAQAVAEAFWAAGEPACCEDSGACGLEPWAPLRLFCWLVRPCCGQVTPGPGEVITTIDVSSVLERRRLALSCHRSQAACCGQAIARLSEPDEAFERFRLGAARVPVARNELPDLFAGISEAG